MNSMCITKSYKVYPYTLYILQFSINLWQHTCDVAISHLVIHHCSMLFSYCATGPHILAHTDDVGSIKLYINKIWSVYIAQDYCSVLYVHMYIAAAGYIHEMLTHVLWVCYMCVHTCMHAAWRGEEAIHICR